MEIEKKEIIAVHKNARISSQKVRLVAKMVKEYSPEEALEKLKFIQKKASKLIIKVLESAIANAEHNLGVDRKNLKIKNIFAEEASTLRRFRARSRGMASRISKRNCHINVIMEEVLENGQKNKKLGKKEVEKVESKEENKELMKEEKNISHEKQNSSEKKDFNELKKEQGKDEKK